uniref:RING-type E3 ubiquitin transferase n=1 Tax=Phallusia mammillata TaxID=59560 RepID=A0A6F9DKX2_9ASCI|nr:mitochondrial ubiquitin ligase activator of NFKB 1-like [Phallusia mammillata]
MTLLETLLGLVDERTVLEASAFAVGTSLSAILYFIHRRYDSKAKVVEDVPIFDINSDFTTLVKEAPFSTLPYVAINGKVSTLTAPLHSQANPSTVGVFLKKTTTEHKDVWGKYTHVWQNEDREVTAISDSIPFDLQGLSSHPLVRVVDPMQSAWFEECAEVVNEEFVPSHTSTVESIVGFVSGERLKGYTQTEKMLRLGTKLCAIGEVVYEDNMLKIKPPASNFGEYILSKFRKGEIVSQMRSKSKIWKLLAVLMGAASLTALYFIMRRLHGKYVIAQDERRLAEELEEVRNQRTVQSGQLNRDDARNTNQGPCVVCLTNPRECVILNCGHICICVDCLEALPTPKECPLCRSRVVRTVPLFHA